MKHPSIRLRLMLGTGLLVALTLWGANVAIYRAFKRTLFREVDLQLELSASLLAKSAELEADSLDYEWKEAMASGKTPAITGLFQFWDLSTGRITRSPDLGDRNLPFIKGKLNKTVIASVRLENGARAKIASVYHYPFADQAAIDAAAAIGKTLRPEDHPQVVVCARETETLSLRLAELKRHLTWGAIATLVAIWGSIFAISRWSLRPIREFNDNLLDQSAMGNPSATEIPKKLPSELVGLAQTFNFALDRVEQARAREKDFAIHAAHELRTPVAGACATLEQAIHRRRSSEELASRIRESLGILTGMGMTLDSLMILARLRGKLETCQSTSFDPLAVIHELLALAQGEIHEHRLTIDMDFSASASPLACDPGLFKIIASNLIGNAIRHSPPSSLISLKAQKRDSTFVFTTRNSCENLTSEDIDRLFEPFQRGSKAADNEGGHAGLGLSIAREAASIMGGSLRARLSDPKHIEFIVEIPSSI